MVLKANSMNSLSDQEKLEIVNEAKILEHSKHPNIIKFFDFFEESHSSKLCIVMEYADDGDLQQKLKAQPQQQFFDEGNVLDWFVQICLGIKHLHDRKCIHRDIKSQNIFLTKDGFCKIGDFGSAKVLNTTYAKASTVIGTPYYLSPEIV